MALADKQLPVDFVVDAALADAIRARLVDEHLPCPAAFVIAAEHEIAPLTVGQTADALGIHLTRCQLGLYGYPGHAKGWDTVADKPSPEGLEAALQAAAEATGKLACVQLWELAAKHHISRLQIGYVADKLGIKIGPCQLGAF